MQDIKSFQSLLYTVNDNSFQDIALKLFRYQSINNPVYSSFLSNLGVTIDGITSVNQIPFLPISFFKSQEVKTTRWESESLFTSSGTTGISTSTHHVYDVEFYKNHSARCFEYFFGDLSKYHFLALLPSYLERSGSSLITMMQHFIEKSESEKSGFYLYDHEKLLRDIEFLKGNKSKKTILWGVSFALLDLADQYSIDLSDCMLFETGGMKGRRREVTRHELHAILKERFNVDRVYSEYGMTELFSQAYSTGDFFSPSPWMKVIGREIGDPLNRGLTNQMVGLNVIDLANIHSIAFIETEDSGRIYDNGSFEVLGRLDNSDVRGCNLLVE